MAAADLTLLTATQAAANIARGTISAEDFTRACLDRIAAVEGDVQAFIHLDPAHALAQARVLDRLKSDGDRIGPLHGIPVAIKDIFDTADYPTEYGSPIFAGRRPTADATVVRKLREAGAVIIGKTVTTEFAYFNPGKTRNPRDLNSNARRLVIGLGRRGGSRHGAAGARVADQWFNDPAGRVLRRVRGQAKPRSDFSRRRADTFSHVGSCRRVCSLD